MATPYEKIYNRFLNRTTDFNLAALDDDTLRLMLKGWLHSAVVQVRTTNDLSYDDELEVFNNDLSNFNLCFLQSFKITFFIVSSISLFVKLNNAAEIGK